MRRDAFRELGFPAPCSAVALAVLAVLRARRALPRRPGRRRSRQRRARVPEPVRGGRREHLGARSRWSSGTCSPPRRADGFTIRVAIISQPDDLGAITPAVAEAGQLRELPRHRAVPRLRAAAADRDAGRVRVQLAGPLRRRGLPGARQIAHRPGGSRPGRVGRDRRAGARRRLGRPARRARRRPASRSPGGGSAGGGTGGAAAPAPTAGQRRRPAASRRRPHRHPVSRLAHRRHRGRGRWPHRGRRLARAARRTPARPATAWLPKLRLRLLADRRSGPGAAAARHPRHLARGRLRRPRGRPDRRARGAHAGGRRGASGSTARTRAWRATRTSTRGRPCPPSRPASPSPTSSASRCRSAPTGARS